MKVSDVMQYVEEGWGNFFLGMAVGAASAIKPELFTPFVASAGAYAAIAAQSASKKQKISIKATTPNEVTRAQRLVKQLVDTQSYKVVGQKAQNSYSKEWFLAK